MMKLDQIQQLECSYPWASCETSLSEPGFGTHARVSLSCVVCKRFTDFGLRGMSFYSRWLPDKKSIIASEERGGETKMVMEERWL